MMAQAAIETILTRRDSVPRQCSFDIPVEVADSGR
jgi:hypothetical protein